ncbi:hypothetical protein [Salimicrobium humidisoli]|uniref:Uncharacterized protein n=1 Tax=Salimicrobium humidisoli TaxID=2029857 RepID=A0ABX4HP52_9BACI|nr:hypothetical protein [Salimicrobium humidisoli]PBB04973.1 hypothetical protein CKW00_11175 [Salimicrobium humidisoli]
MNETELKYSIRKPTDGTDDRGVTLKFNKEIELVQNIVVNPDDKRFFQRIKVYSNGFVFTEEVWSDCRMFRFSDSFKQEGNTLYFEF